MALIHPLRTVLFLLIFKNFLIGTISIGISISSQYVGDREIAWRIKIAAERLGWKVTVDEENGRKIQNRKDLDWVICMLPENKFRNPYCPNYLMVFHPINYLTIDREFHDFYHKYDGYLLTINDRESLEKGLEKKGKKFHYTTFYPTSCSTPYKITELNNLMMMIPVWGNRLKGKKYRLLFHWLSLTDYSRFYGIDPNEDIIHQGYMGSIPFNGFAVIDILQKHGISLVIHSDLHNREGIPSGRIFEAAAASCVIICDQNPFVKKYFGDSVFYVDTSASPEILFEEIHSHVTDIKINPEKALEMAKKSHEIFIQNFSMEEQLNQLKEMHEQVIKDKKE